MIGLRDALRMRGIQFKDHASDRNEIRLCCPRPACGDTTFRFGVNVATGQAHCFNCDYRSRNSIKALMKWLALQPVSIEQEEAQKKKLEEIDLPEGSVALGKKPKMSIWTRKAFTYLQARGMSQQDMIDKRVILTEIGKYSHRVVFPVIVKKRVVGLVARSIIKSQKPKYLNTRGMKSIWNIPGKPMESVILCEGVFKALALEKMFDRFSVGALLGHSITQIQIEQLKGAKLVLIWPDPDPVGIRGAVKIAYKLRGKFKVALPRIIPYRQADEMGAEELVRVFQSMNPFTEALRCRYEFQAIKRKQDEE